MSGILYDVRTYYTNLDSVQKVFYRNAFNLETNELEFYRSAFNVA